MTDANPLPYSNDILYRRLILQHYNDCILYGTQLMVYVTAEIRRGPISSKADPFKLALANLLYNTENISEMGKYKELSGKINAWLQTVPSKDRRKQTDHYLKGIDLMKQWSKALIVNKIIEFR